MKKQNPNDIGKPNLDPIELTNDAEMWNQMKKIEQARLKKEQVKPKYGIPPPKRKK